VLSGVRLAATPKSAEAASSPGARHWAPRSSP